MGKIGKTTTKEIKEFKKWLIAENGCRFIDIFNYENDRIFLKNLLKEIKHIAFGIQI